jgi:monoamine oxidase
VPTAIDYPSIIRSGLPHTTTPGKKVVVIGAGMAGLTAAYELRRAGYEPIVLEAQQRVGGRVCTLREPFSDGLYAEAGAMRIPKAHDLTMGYIEKLNVPIAPFTMGNQNGYYHLHGKRLRIMDANTNPDALGFEVAPHERGRTASQLWADCLKPRSLRNTISTARANSWRPATGPKARSRCSGCWRTRKR